MTNDVEFVPTADEIERVAAEHMSTAPAQAVANLVVAAEQMRDSEALHRTANHFTRLAAEMVHAAAVARVAAHHLITAFQRVASPGSSLYWRRVEGGGMATDAERWPDQWVTYHCAAFLCGDCPTADLDLQCNCPCHRKGRNRA